MPGKTYDVIIIGAGPAGLTAAIYTARYKLSTLVLGADMGGNACLAHDIQNWPGLKAPGMEIMQKFREHAASFGVEIVSGIVKKVKKNDSTFTVSTEKNAYDAPSIIIATGSKRRKLEIPGEDTLAGKGVSYCATCDAMFFKDKVVGVVGGSNAAAMAAQVLTQHADKVYIIYRKSKMRAEPIRVEELEKHPKIEFIYNANVLEIVGEDRLQKVKLDTGQEIELDGLFIEIGGVPVTAIAKELGIDLAENQRIKVGQGMETSVPGVFAAGDITTGSNQFDQVVTAAAEGAIAALGVFNFLKKSAGK